MSRIGKKPINLSEKVDIEINHDYVIVKGPKGELKERLPRAISIKKHKQQVQVIVSKAEEKERRALWGSFRQLIANMVEGVTNGFEKKLEINGIGYRAETKGNELVLNLGYAHAINFKLPAGIKAQVEKNIITISGVSKYLVGETAAQIRKLRKPEPYKGKGIKYFGEVVRRKAGKQAKGVEGAGK